MALQLWRRRPPAGSEIDLAEAMLDWYCTPPGRVLQSQIGSILDELLPGLFGYHLVWVGPLPEPSWWHSSPIRHRVVVSAQRGGEPHLHARALASALPLATDSVDVVVLHHALEMTASPHEVLREAERVLIPEGRVVIFGFSPWSLWGMRRAVMPWDDRAPWALGYLSLRRIKDWLALLGLELEHQRRLLYTPPCRSAALLCRFSFLEWAGRRLWPFFGGAYAVVARKRISRPTLVGPRWRRRGRIAVPGLVGTSNRNPS